MHAQTDTHDTSTGTARLHSPDVEYTHTHNNKSLQRPQTLHKKAMELRCAQQLADNHSTEDIHTHQAARQTHSLLRRNPTPTDQLRKDTHPLLSSKGLHAIRHFLSTSALARPPSTTVGGMTACLVTTLGAITARTLPKHCLLGQSVTQPQHPFFHNTQTVPRIQVRRVVLWGPARRCR
jgi:hypothetical protein